MKLGAILFLFFCFFPVCPARGQSVLVCTFESKTAVAKETEDKKLTIELREREEGKLSVVFAQLDSTQPVLKVRNVEKPLTPLRRDTDLIWLRDSTFSTIGEGVLVWMIDLKEHVVVRSESLRTTRIEGQDWSGKPMAILEIGKCE